ncbi:MAG: DUF401 family protein [Acidobacteria bacterium]|nr:DUF401 family protein [Acidobacteriota bacterium]
MFALSVTLGAFGLILLCARLRVPLGLSIILGSAAVGLGFGLDGAGLARAAWTGATAPQTIALALVTALLLGLSVLMRESGRLEEIVTLAHRMLRRPVATMVAMPALIGLLPMPGGAIFSAPMVESASGRSEVARSLLSSINYWFRHIWEFFWPLYPGVLLAMALTHRAIPAWTALMIFGTAAMFLGGLVMLRGIPADLQARSAPPPPGTKRKLLKATGSIWVILLGWGAAYLLAGLLLDRVPADSVPGMILKHGPLVIGLLGSILWTVLGGALGGQALRKAFWQPGTYSLAGLIFAILIFQHTLEAVGAPGRIAEELQSLHVPLVLVVAVLPFIAGFVTGIAVGFVGTALPIVLNLVGAVDGAAGAIAYIPLSYTFGHLGQMMSPIHVCQIVSNRYFGTTYGPVYRRILPSALITALLNIGYFLFLRWIY